VRPVNDYGEEVMKRVFLLSLICAAIFLVVAIALVKLVPANDSGVVEAAPGKVTQGALEVRP
jgi:hypothetical protein